MHVIGSDDSWATPETTHTYYRNIQMWATTAPSNLTGQVVKSAAGPRLNALISIQIVMSLSIGIGMLLV